MKNFQNLVVDYCEDHSISSLQELYKEFGTPNEVLHSYYLNADIRYILQRIRITKLLKRFLIFITILALIVSASYCLYLYSEYQTIKKQQIFFEETIIE